MKLKVVIIALMVLHSADGRQNLGACQLIPAPIYECTSKFLECSEQKVCLSHTAMSTMRGAPCLILKIGINKFLKLKECLSGIEYETLTNSTCCNEHNLVVLHSCFSSA